MNIHVLNKTRSETLTLGEQPFFSSPFFSYGLAQCEAHFTCEASLPFEENLHKKYILALFK